MESLAAALRFLARWLITFSLAAAFSIYVLSVLIAAKREIPAIVEGQREEIQKQLKSGRTSPCAGTRTRSQSRPCSGASIRRSQAAAVDRGRTTIFSRSTSLPASLSRDPPEAAAWPRCAASA